MGAGVPMAVAACLRDRNRQVVSFSGDGGTLMTGNELATARMYGVNPILVVSDNKSYGTISMHHINRYPGRPYAAATDLRNPDFAAWARSFGAEGIVISAEAEVAPKIAQAFAIKDRPVVIHVHSSAEQMSAWRRKN
jgi:acetolactate synthase-1/2/3 large subunit